MQTTLFTKYQHGGLPVVISDEGFKLGKPEGEVMFTSKRGLMLEIYGGKDLHMTFDKYFKRGRHQKSGLAEKSEITVFDFFTPKPKIAKKVARKTKTEILLAPGVKPKLGIDLERRGHEVAKLFYAGFASDLIKSGYEPEDVLQDIYRGIIARNSGECPFDPAKSSFGHYVHMVCRCMVLNHHRREGKRKSREVVGLPTYSGGEWGSADISENESALVQDVAETQEDLRMKELVDSLEKYIDKSSGVMKRDKNLAKSLVPYLLGGFTQKEIGEILGYSKSILRRGISTLRDLASKWRSEFKILLPIY